MGCSPSLMPRRQEKRRMRYASKPLTLKSFSIRHMLGEGFFSKVCSVCHKPTDKIFALKLIDKWKCIESGYVPHTIAEVDILKHTHHDNIVKLWFTFYDEEHLCMGLECYDGGNLFYHRVCSNITAEACIIYLLEIGSALEYLRRQSVIHRDLKPDNIMLDLKGHSYLTDFNLATKIKAGERLRERLGTPQYLAPEIKLERSYSYAVDWWGLGYSLYEVTQKKDLKVKYYEDSAQVELCYSKSAFNNCPRMALALKELLRADETQRCTRLDRLSRILQVTIEDVRSGKVKPIFIPTDKVNVVCCIDAETTAKTFKGKASSHRKRRTHQKTRNKASGPLLDGNDVRAALLDSVFEEYCATGLYDSVALYDESFEEVERLEPEEISQRKPKTTSQVDINVGASTSSDWGIHYKAKKSVIEFNDRTWRATIPKIIITPPTDTITRKVRKVRIARRSLARPYEENRLTMSDDNIRYAISYCAPKHPLNESLCITDTYTAIYMYSVKRLKPKAVLL